MLSQEEKLAMNFIESCRNHLMMKDELLEVETKMFNLLEEVNSKLKLLDECKPLQSEFEKALYDTLKLTKEVYFEYGNHYGGTFESQSYAEVLGLERV